jgi:hypothetical protein
MEVRLRRRGCLIAFASVVSLGLVPLVRMFQMRKVIGGMDEDGIVTRGGTRIAWADFTEVRRQIWMFESFMQREDYLLRSAKGRAALPAREVLNAEEAVDFLLKHLPPDIKRSERRYRTRIR